MKNVFGLKKTVLAASIVAASLAPAIAAAEVSGTLGASSQYLWRGQQLTDGAAVYGSVDYSHTSGLYAGAWGSSETDDTEYDLYAGFGGEFEGLSYDISYIDYNYTAGGTAGDENEHERKNGRRPFRVWDIGRRGELGVVHEEPEIGEP